MNFRLVTSFIVLFASTVLASLHFTTEKVSLNVSIRGICLMIVYTGCSSIGSIFMEYITKVKFQQQDIYIQNIKFSICSILCNIVVICIRGQLPFTNFHLIHLVVIVTGGIYGLITAIVIKFGGSILKTYSVSSSIFLSALFSYFVFGSVLEWNFIVGSFCCLFAVHLYSNEIRSERKRNEEIVEIVGQEVV